MILLASDCLVFQMANGENIPFSSEMISVELMGDAAALFDPDFVKNAAAAVFFHFKHDRRRTLVTVGEFSLALERVLRGFAITGQSPDAAETAPPVTESDLRQLANETGKAELFFFPRLRDELRSQLRHSPQMLRFRGLRGCVKQLAGAQRWSARCQVLQDQIVDYLRNCLSADASRLPCALVVV